MLRLWPVLAFVLSAIPALATDFRPAVKASIRDQPLDGVGDTFNASPFEGLVRKGTASGVEDRAIQEFDVSSLAWSGTTFAEFSGTISSNNAFDVGVRTFEFVLYAGNGVAELADYSVPGLAFGVGNYHPPQTTTFTYQHNVTPAIHAMLQSGATWIGLRVQCTSDPNYPNVLDDVTSVLRIYPAVTTGSAMCSGDGLGAQCPCNNHSPIGVNLGCLNSLGVGARLVGSGIARVSNDTFVLEGSNLPNAPGLYFQGTAPTAGGLGAPFGDGLRCASGTVIRLGTKAASSGLSTYPTLGDPPVSVRGLVPPTGGTYYYQVWYRNAAAFCTASTFNLTNGWTTTWVP